MQRLGREAYLIIFIIFLLLMLGAMSLRTRNAKQKGGSYQADASFAELRYPYSRMSPREQQLYDVLYAGISDFQDTIALPGTYTAEEYKHVYLNLRMQEPELFYVERVYELADEMDEANIIYRMSRETAEALRSQLDAAADRILAGVSRSLPEWEQVLQIHDAIGAGCRYGKGAYSDDAVGSLVDGTAQCEGYSQGLLYTLRRAGFDAMCVPGHSGNGTDHVWNIVKIDGAYYNIDLTWDDANSYGTHTAHTCFAMPDAEFSDHYHDPTAYIPPACSTAQQTFYQRRGYLLSEPAQLDMSVNQWMMQQGGSFMEFCCRDKSVMDNVRQALSAHFSGTGYAVYWDEVRHAAVIMPQ